MSNFDTQPNSASAAHVYDKSNLPPILMVVDDEPQIVGVLQELFEDEGYEVIPAENGRHALAKIDESPPDVVLADIMMPELDGYSLLQEIRNRELETEVVLMSAAQRPLRNEAHHINFVAKPFDLDQLVDLISKLVRRRKY